MPNEGIQQANALLIAAAPDLLKALQDVAVNPIRYNRNAVMAAIRAALAKAEGKA